MALSVKVTNFNWLTTQVAGTTIDVTLGFQPKFVILFCGGTTATAGTDSVAGGDAIIGMGFGVSDTDRRAIGYGEPDAAANANISIMHFADTVFCMSFGSSSTNNEGALDISAVASWPADGIQFVVDRVSSHGHKRVTVLAIGGSDITEAKTFQFQEPASSGAQAVAHGLGGAPTGCAFMTLGFATAPWGASSTQGMLSFGMSDGTTSWVTYVGQDDAAATMDTVAYAKTGEVISMGPEPAVTLDGRATVSSFDATNINLSWAERASTRYIFGLAWRGGQFKCSSVTTATNTTPFNGPTNGFIAQAALFASCGRAASTADTPTAHSQWSIGAATSASERAAQGYLDQDNVAASITTVAIEHDEVYLNIDATEAIQGLMDVTSVAADPWTLVMDDADPTNNFVGVASWGATASVDLPYGKALLPDNVRRVPMNPEYFVARPFYYSEGKPQKQDWWPLPQYKTKPTLVDYLNLLGNTLAVPFIPTHWPTPQRPAPERVSFIVAGNRPFDNPRSRELLYVPAPRVLRALLSNEPNLILTLDPARNPFFNAWANPPSQVAKGQPSNSPNIILTLFGIPFLNIWTNPTQERLRNNGLHTTALNVLLGTLFGRFWLYRNHTKTLGNGFDRDSNQ